MKRNESRKKNALLKSIQIDGKQIDGKREERIERKVRQEVRDLAVLLACIISIMFMCWFVQAYPPVSILGTRPYCDELGPQALMERRPARSHARCHLRYRRRRG